MCSLLNSNSEWPCVAVAAAFLGLAATRAGFFGLRRFTVVFATFDHLTLPRAITGGSGDQEILFL